MKLPREVLVSVVLLGAVGLLLHSLSYGEDVPQRQRFAAFPLRLARWTGTELRLDTRVLEVLRVDDYMLRQYWDEHGQPIGFYVGYYKSQRQGTTYHSPKNCLPGAGWALAKVTQTRLDVAERHGQAVVINGVVIQKGLDRQLVFYWYQDRGRILTSEYWAKLYMVLDGLKKNRTDGALVRVTVPLTGDGEATAFERGRAFAVAIFPLLQAYLPG